MLMTFISVYSCENSFSVQPERSLQLESAGCLRNTCAGRRRNRKEGEFIYGMPRNHAQNGKRHLSFPASLLLPRMSGGNPSAATDTDAGTFSPFILDVFFTFG